MISSLGKLTDRPSDGMGPTGRVSGRGWSISRGRSGRYRWVGIKGVIGFTPNREQDLLL
ncbi:hypothetical protein YC2023_009538 [Brassica napus]